MHFKKGGVDVITLSTQGDITFAPYYEEENLPVPVDPGELKITAPSGDVLLATREVLVPPAARLTDVALRGRFSTQAALPVANCLRIREPGGNFVAALTTAGDLLVSGEDLTVTTILPDPGDDGPYNVTPVVYAEAGLIYPVGLAPEFGLFQTPTVNYTTRHIDLSEVFNTLSDPTFGDPDFQWPFDIRTVPINGMAWIPQGAGPFPLIVFAHGNHDALDNSTPGYAYLCQMLATHGIIAATIDANFFNQGLYGENAARALLHLEHVKQFVQEWNGLGGHPLHNKVDRNRVIIAGHSRGGEAVAHASLFNGMDSLAPHPPPDDYVVPVDGSGLGAQQLGPYHFGLRGVIAIAPTDDQYKPMGPLLPKQVSTVVDHTSYLLIHGSMDADVSDFPGYRAYDRALPYDLNNMRRPASGYKSLLWVYNANHNYFNTVWGHDAGQRPPRLPAGLIAAADQQTIAKVFFGAWAQIHLLWRSSYWALFRKPQIASTLNWLNNPVTLVSQYHDKERLWLQTYDNTGDIEITAPVTGTWNKAGGIAVNKVYLDTGAESTLYEETGGLRIGWGSKGVGEKYFVDNLVLPPDIDRFQVLSLRVGQSQDALNPGTPQDFTIQISEGGNTYTVQASALMALPYPAKISTPPFPPDALQKKMVMQTLRIPLGEVAATPLDVRRIDKVEFIFDVTNTGKLFFDDLQLSL